MNKKEKNLLYKIILAILLLILSQLFHNYKITSLVLYLASYLLVGLPVIIKAIKNTFKGKVIEENFLMAIATIGAFALGEYLEGVLVMLLYQIGELFQDCAVSKSRKSISELMDIRPDYANLLEDDVIKKVDPNTVKVEDIIIVKPGEKIPLDGIVIEGKSHIDTSSLTGESTLLKVKENDCVVSGCINKSGLIKIKVTKGFKESTVSKILDLIENASSKKSRSENFITKFARYYTPIVVLLALLLTFLLPLFTNITMLSSFRRALSFLVISCPCALVISVPLSFFGGIGSASKVGILIKGSNYLEALANAKTVVFDKTGTLTEGNFSVTKIEAIGVTKDELLELASLAEAYSSHPIAEAIKKAYGKEIDQKQVKDVSDLAGKGVEATVHGKKIHIGNLKLMESLKIDVQKEDVLGTVSYIAIDGVYSGYIVIADKPKKEAERALFALRKSGIDKIIMLTGDNDFAAKKAATSLKIDEYYSELLPNDKLDKIEEFIDQKPRNLIFVGDGINDAPSLIRADVGIAMGNLGTDAAIESADVVIMDDDLTKIQQTIMIAKKTIKIVKQNIYFSIAVKFIFLGLGAFGIATMMTSVFADVGVSILAILNALRTLYIKGHD